MKFDFPELVCGSELELIHLYGGELTTRPGDVQGPRYLADFEFLYIIEGSVEYRAGGDSYAVPRGGLIMGRPGSEETYFWDPKIPTRHAYFHFALASYPSDWPNLDQWPRVRTELSPLMQNLVKHIVQRIYQNYTWPAEAPGRSDRKALELLMDLFLCTSSEAEEPEHPERPEPVRKALQYMSRLLEDAPEHALTLAELSAVAHVTEKHLCRLFASTLGCSPLKTFTLLKLQGARQLLTRTNLSIKEISERCGFNSPYYFSRCCSKAFGVSPSALRDAPTLPENPLPPDLIPRTYW